MKGAGRERGGGESEVEEVGQGKGEVVYEEEGGVRTK